MQIPIGACPITYERVSVQCAAYGNEQDWNLFGCDGDWAGLSAAVMSSCPVPATVRLRAFFAIELMYCSLVPRKITSVESVAGVREKMHKLRFDRTESGVRQLAALSSAYAKKVAARSTIQAIKGSGALGYQVAPMLSELAASFQDLSVACSALLLYLRDGSIEAAATIGSSLSSILATSTISTLEEEQLLRTLLSVSESNPMHAWERT